jgi:hypothetical protein
MAIFHFHMTVVKRSRGQCVVQMAASRSGTRLYSERYGRTRRPLRSNAPDHSELLLPAGAPLRWLDRATLWNEVEGLERRDDGQLAKEVEMALPQELDLPDAIRLARDFVVQAFVARGMVADLNIWFGPITGEARQPHAQVLLTM